MPSTPPDVSRRRLLVIPLGLLLILAAIAALLASSELISARKSRGWVRHSYQVIETTQTLFSDVQDVESGVRGYMASGDPRFLDHFYEGMGAAPRDSQKLIDLTQDNPEQSQRAHRLVDLVKQRMAIAAMRVNLARQGRQAEARTVQFAAGKTSMEQARQVKAELTAAEERLLALRTAQADRAEWESFVVAMTVAGLATIGVTYSMITMALTNRRLAHEIDERRAAEDARRESEARYRAIFANSADYLYVIDVRGEDDFRMAEVNPAYERATGGTTLRLRGVDVRLMSEEPRSSALVAHLRRVVASGKPTFSRDKVKLPGGERVWESVMVPVRNAAGEVDRIVGSSRDVTEREEAQAQLRRAQRMEAVGHLTGGVAHDFNNLLQVIRGNLELLVSQIDDREQSLQRARNALHGADRAAQLTRQLLAFARRQPLEPKVINLGRLVTDMAEMLRRTLGEAIEVETVIAGGLWNTLADPAQVESAILNLAINARDAMGPGGRLTIEITNSVLDEEYARREADIEPGQYVLLAVSDTGHGMSPETMSKVFEPFFTTKGEEKGTGLGLSMVYGFVKQSQGHIQIYSEVGQGTTVKIYLPRSRQAEPVSEPAPSGSLRGRSEVILVVEDDDLVRTAVVGMLRDLGYSCLHVADAAAGLEVLRQGVKIDLLFTDVVMPGPVKSRDLATEAQRLRPGLPVLFTSGYTDNAIVHHGRLMSGVQLISKPYAREDLARRLRGLLKPRQPVVLVVEDDALVRLAAVDMISALGFTTLQAADAESALTILDKGERIDVLFTDVGLPGMRGPELAEAACKARPDLKIIFASGYGDALDASALDGAVQLGKPYQQDHLAKVLGEATASL
ncbi:MAG: CHASE3 domain-containing protein [Caulobacteraceae bacterium]|nr:CHASE3 domain-containing protein [Caulobacteraceae bacterium]